MRAIDWRRSARADEQFVRENEWQAAQAVQFWIDNSAAMQFSSQGESKQHRAAMIALAPPCWRQHLRLRPGGLSCQT
ncbi:DUF58 domain-containing protein [Planktomarina temperata]|nr:DUF58 domain-containing protein [Planktomarina temperata]